MWVKISLRLRGVGCLCNRRETGFSHCYNDGNPPHMAAGGPHVAPARMIRMDRLWGNPYAALPCAAGARVGAVELWDCPHPVVWAPDSVGVNATIHRLQLLLGHGRIILPCPGGCPYAWSQPCAVQRATASGALHTSPSVGRSPADQEMGRFRTRTHCSGYLT